MDLVRLLSAAPSWVRVAVSVLAALWASATVVTNALRAVPEDRFVALERSLPRLGQLLRAARKFGTDVLPFVAALAGALAGLPVQRVERDARYGDDAMPPRPEAPPAIDPQRGHIRPALLGVLLLVAAGLFATRCRPATDAGYALAGLPPASQCSARAYRCSAGVPEVCARGSGTAGALRWWPTVPPGPDGRRAPCACVVDADGGVAHCSGPDGGAR